MPLKYAADTDVAPEKSMMEIRAMLKKHGATMTSFIESEAAIGVEFIITGRRIRFLVPLKSFDETRRRTDGTRKGDVQAQQAYDKMLRSTWRGLLLIINAKLESLLLGIETLEQTFMAQLVLADNRTMSEVILPQLQSGQLLLSSGGK